MSLARRSQTHGRTGFTIVELLVVIAIFAILAAVLLAVLSRARDGARRSSCAANLRQMAIALSMYSDEDPGERYPTLPINSSLLYDVDTQRDVYIGSCMLSNPAEEGGPVNGTFDWRTMFPGYIADPGVNLCPSDLHLDRVLNTGAWHVDIDDDQVGDAEAPFDPCAITSESYAYFAWAVRSGDPDDPEASIPVSDYVSGLANIISQRITEGPKVYDQNFRGVLSGRTVYRMRAGVERFYVTDINNPVMTMNVSSDIVLMADLVSVTVERFNHVPGGANVLFLDGHVEFIKYPGRFPVSQDFSFAASFFGA